MSDPLRIGFIGGGFITRFHIQSLLQVRDCVVAGVADMSEESAESAAALAKSIGVGPNARAFESNEALAADPEVDAIWVCAPNHARVEIMQAIRQGAQKREQPLKGICAEKPLARTLAEALEVEALSKEIGAPTGYLEDIIFAPSLVRGREVLWRRGASNAGRPYLARAAEEHGGPHSAWFWQKEIAGGGVLLDMMCHSIEAARWLLTEPGAPRNSLTPVEVSATCANLKWTQPKYANDLSERYGGEVDWATDPTEDFARATVKWKTEEGQTLLTETSSSWSYVGAGLRHTFQLLGPEYSLDVDMADAGVKVFFSREVSGDAGEDLVEKQNAEQGQMPLVPDEPAHYGYSGENRHFVDAFLGRTKPRLTFQDGVEVMRLLMAAYQSSAEGRTVDPSTPSLESYTPFT
ncbi:MAG TPA: dehydrogenase [Planctomycetes bacterium]|nr:dehydrogenase [Planctomycetota bacterium]|tara:strand:+ start:53 stop:1273 length:1221 start_codon:yes stop_codon:yes gene_type:complete